MEKLLDVKIKQWKEYQSIIASCEHRLFNGLCNPFEDSLFPGEKEQLEMQISKRKKESQDLLEEIKLMFQKKYSSNIPNHLKEVIIENIDIIKMINLNPNILSLPIEELDIIFHIDNINRVSAFLICNSLIENQNAIKLLIEKIKDKTITEYYFSKNDVSVMESVLSINNQFDKEFLFLIGKSYDSIETYLNQNIDDEKILSDIYSIYSKNKELIKSLLRIKSDIIEGNQNLFFESSDTNLEKMKIFVLANIKKTEIVQRYIELYEYAYCHKDYIDINKLFNIMINFKIRIAMLSAKTVDHQNKLFEFISQTNTTVTDENFSYYYLVPLSKIGSINLNEFGNCQILFENMKMNDEEQKTQNQQKQKNIAPSK